MRSFVVLIIIIFFAFTTLSQSKGPTPIDEFGSINCETYLARMDNVFVQAANNLDAQIYVLVYEGKVSRYVYDRSGEPRTQVLNPEFGLARAKIRSMKKLLTLKRSANQNFVFVPAGFREDFTVELWLVPKGSEKPIPKPTFAKMKYRKGKPSGFCLGCCGP